FAPTKTAALSRFCANSRLHNRRRYVDPVLFRPGLERGHDRRIERGAALELFAITLHAALARKAHTLAARAWLGVARRRRDEIHLPLEFGQAAECFWVESLDERSEE